MESRHATEMIKPAFCRVDRGASNELKSARCYYVGSWVAACTRWGNCLAESIHQQGAKNPVRCRIRRSGKIKKLEYLDEEATICHDLGLIG